MDESYRDHRVADAPQGETERDRETETGRQRQREIQRDTERDTEIAERARERKMVVQIEVGEWQQRAQGQSARADSRPPCLDYLPL